MSNAPGDSEAPAPLHELTFCRPTTGHVAAAVALAVVIAGVYGAIAWGKFVSGNGFEGHLVLAQRLYDTGRLPVPHFLFHALAAALYAAHLAPSILFASRVVVVACYVLIALVMYGLLWAVFRGARIGRPSILFLAGLAALLAEPITLSRAYALGFLWPEPYEIPTSTVMKPFALASFACTAWCLVRRSTIDWRLAGLFAAATIAGTLSKPSFIICLLPASAVLAAYRLARRLPVSSINLLAGLYIPAAAVLAWQFYVTYLGAASSGMYHDSIVWAPLKFMNGWTTGILPKFLLSITFPLVVSLLYWRQAYRDTILQLGWLCFFAGAFYTYMLVEKFYWASGNMVWSGYIATFTLLVASMVFWLRQLTLTIPSGWASWSRILIAGTAIALQAASGARIDFLYLTHYGCQLNFRIIDFNCGG